MQHRLIPAVQHAPLIRHKGGVALCHGKLRKAGAVTKCSLFQGSRTTPQSNAADAGAGAESIQPNHRHGIRNHDHSVLRGGIAERKRMQRRTVRKALIRDFRQSRAVGQIDILNIGAVIECAAYQSIGKNGDGLQTLGNAAVGRPAIAAEYIVESAVVLCVAAQKRQRDLLQRIALGKGLCADVLHAGRHREGGEVYRAVEGLGSHGVAGIGNVVGGGGASGGVGVQVQAALVKQHAVLIGELQVVGVHGDGGQVFAAPEGGWLDGGDIPANGNGVDPRAVGKGVLVDADDAVGLAVLRHRVGNDDAAVLAAVITGVVVVGGVFTHGGGLGGGIQPEVDALPVTVVIVQRGEVCGDLVSAHGVIAVPLGGRPTGGAAVVEDGEVGGCTPKGRSINSRWGIAEKVYGSQLAAIIERIIVNDGNTIADGDRN